MSIKIEAVQYTGKESKIWSQTSGVCQAWEWDTGQGI